MNPRSTTAGWTKRWLYNGLFKGSGIGRFMYKCRLSLMDLERIVHD